MKLGLRFGEPNFWKILNDWPPSLIAYWNAYYLLQPWDEANANALVMSGYKPPRGLLSKVRRRLNGSVY
jgi:hypothetical protein